MIDLPDIDRKKVEAALDRNKRGPFGWVMWSANVGISGILLWGIYARVVETRFECVIISGIIGTRYIATCAKNLALRVTRTKRRRSSHCARNRKWERNISKSIGSRVPCSGGRRFYLVRAVFFWT